MFDDVYIGTIRPNLKLLNSSSTECISRTEDYLFSLRLEIGGHLTDGGGLSHTVDTDNQNHRRFGI